jgi:hypothetical protein
MRNARLQIAALVFASTTAGSTAVYGQQNTAEERLVAAKALECKFTTMATGTWRDGQAQMEIKAASLTIAFQAIDSDEGSARAVGAFGPSDITVKLSSGTLHFLQSFREGPLYVTTVFSRETKNGNLQAVHTRHEYTVVTVPGFTSRPEQYFGECSIK